MEVKLLGIIAFLLLGILMFIIVTVFTYFITKGEELASSRPITAKKWDLHGSILFIFGLVMLLLLILVGSFIAHYGINWG